MGPALPKQDRKLLVALFAISLVASFALGFRPKVNALYGNVDGSYLFAANYASEKGLRWGRDFVSTFGPYAYLIYASDVGEIAKKKVASELILAALVGAAAALYLASAPGLGFGARIALALLLIYAIHLQGNSIYGDEYRWFALLIVLMLLAVHSAGVLGVATFFLASAMAGFFVLVKLSLGAAGILSLLAGSLLSSRRIPNLALLAAGGAVGFALGWLFHQGTLEGMLSFASAALPVVSGYSSAMSVAPEGWQRTAFYFAGFVLVLYASGLAIRSDRAVVTLLACAVPLFIAWKHAMVRQDKPHVEVFVLLGLFVASLLVPEALVPERRSRGLLLAACLPALLAPWLLWARADEIARRLWAPFDLRMDGSPPPSLEKFRLSDEIRRQIGDSPVDVYPWESVYVAANDLAWRNRPSPASFATYAPVLDERNALFFSSAQRPRYLLWTVEKNVYSIDGRHLFWDEPMTLRAILGCYRLVRGEGALLLEESPEPRLSTPRRFHVSEAEWGTWIPVPESEGVILAAPDLHRPWWFPIRKALLREDPTYLSLRFNTGGERTYRFIPDQAGSGLWVSPLPRNLPQLRAILRGDLAGPRVRAIRFEGGSKGSRIVVSWLRILPLRES